MVFFDLILNDSLSSWRPWLVTQAKSPSCKSFEDDDFWVKCRWASEGEWLHKYVWIASPCCPAWPGICLGVFLNIWCWPKAPNPVWAVVVSAIIESFMYHVQNHWKGHAMEYFLAVQWLRFSTLTPRTLGLIPSWGKISCKLCSTSLKKKNGHGIGNLSNLDDLYELFFCLHVYLHALIQFSADGWGCVPFLLFGLWYSISQ